MSGDRILELGGGLLIVGGLSAIYWPVALIVAGAALILVSESIGRHNGPTD